MTLVSACSTASQLLDKRAQHHGFEKGLISGDTYQHVSYQKNTGSKHLHVYLDGDGQPWISPYIIAEDPTPRRSLILDLMALDSNDSLYLARPCYNGSFHAEHCSNRMWTSHRYANAVVSSMTTAIKNYLSQHDYQDVVLIGHSGGGSLSMLIADRLPATTTVVTIAANLDTDAWTQQHGYSPLSGSLNPTRRPPLSVNIWQLHLAGSADDNVPPQIIHNGVERQHNAELLIFAHYSHRCCWEKAWPDILKALSNQETYLLKQKYTQGR